MIFEVNDVRVGRVVRGLRERLGWRQIDLAQRAGVSQQEVSLVERGHIAAAPLRIVRSILAALDASAEVDLRWRGGALDRLLDERHSALVGETLGRLESAGWETATEVTYSVYGERGSMDIAAWRADARIALVVEVKSELASIEETLRKHDEKTRLARTILRERFSWEPRTTARLLVLPADRTTRRRTARARHVLERAYPLVGDVARAWLRAPSPEPVALLLFVTDTSPGGSRRRAGRVREARRAAVPVVGAAATTPDGV